MKLDNEAVTRNLFLINIIYIYIKKEFFDLKLLYIYNILDKHLSTIRRF